MAAGRLFAVNSTAIAIANQNAAQRLDLESPLRARIWGYKVSSVPVNDPASNQLIEWSAIEKLAIA